MKNLYPDLADSSSRFFVYGLQDPYTDEIRYIGLSTQGMKRPKQHLSKSVLEREERGGRTHKTSWIRSLRERGVVPSICVLRECSSAPEVREAEIELIAQYRRQGARLTNYAEGGQGAFGAKHSDAAKAEQRKRMLGTVRSPESIAKRTASRAGWTPSPEAREKISQASKGKPKPAGFGERISAAKKGKPRPEGFGEKMSALMKGRPPSNPEHIKALGASWKGKTRSEETKARMSEAKRQYWAARKEREAEAEREAASAGGM